MERHLTDDGTLRWEVDVTETLIDKLVDTLSDHNPIHLSHEEAVAAGFRTRVLHGVGLLGIISSAIATDLPGPGSVILKLDAKYMHPAHLGDRLICKLEIDKIYRSVNTIRLKYIISKSDDGRKLVQGTVTVQYSTISAKICGRLR